MTEQIKAFYAAHRGAVLGCLAGIVGAILLLTLGFWRTLLIALLVALGVNIGKKRDQDMSFSDILLSYIQFWRRVGGIAAAWFRDR